MTNLRTCNTGLTDGRVTELVCMVTCIDRTWIEVPLVAQRRSSLRRSCCQDGGRGWVTVCTLLRPCPATRAASLPTVNAYGPTPFGGRWGGRICGLMPNAAGARVGAGCRGQIAWRHTRPKLQLGLNAVSSVLAALQSLLALVGC